VILLIDNYDSFTYNLYQVLSTLGADVEVHRNDTLTIDEVYALHPAGIVISPGPGRPDDAGISVDIIRDADGSIPILGVCLGHQCIGAAFGGRVDQAPTLMHGKVSTIRHTGRGVFAGLPRPMDVVRYHSLVVGTDLPDCLEVTAETDDGVIMGVRHRTLPIEGVQFHPESILTRQGPDLLANFVRKC